MRVEEFTRLNVSIYMHVTHHYDIEKKKTLGIPFIVFYNQKNLTIVVKTPVTWLWKRCETNPSPNGGKLSEVISQQKIRLYF